jgi:hypothetical protein
MCLLGPLLVLHHNKGVARKQALYVLGHHRGRIWVYRHTIISVVAHVRC